MNIEENITNFKFQHSLKTRWKDSDAFRHINNAVYLSYIEDARLELLKRWKITQDGKSVIVASVKIDYYKQVIHPTELIIFIFFILFEILWNSQNLIDFNYLLKLSLLLILYKIILQDSIVNKYNLIHLINILTLLFILLI